MPFDNHANFGYALILIPPVPALSGTSLTLAAGGGALLPAAPFNATVWPTAAAPFFSNAEIIRVTAIVGDTLTIERAQEDSNARPIVAGDQFANTITKKVITDIEDAINAIPAAPVSSVFGRTGAVVAQNGDYTFAQIGSPPTTLAGYGITDAQAYNVNLSAIAALANAVGWLHNDGSGIFSYSTPTKSDIGLGNVENIALSTWTGSSSITTLGSIISGVWKGTVIDVIHGGTGLNVSPMPIESDQIASGISSSTFDSFGITLKCNSGKIIIVYRSALTHVSAGDYGVINMRSSTDQGMTWSAVTTLASLSNYDLRNVGGGVTGTGRLIVFFGRLNPDINPWNEWLDQGYIYSDDEGVTWSIYQTIERDGMQFISPYGGMIEIADGRLMQSWYGDDGTNYRNYVVFSDDNGSTWDSPIYTLTSTTERFSEGSFVYLGGNSIVGLVRIDNGTTWRQVKSIDNGQTWTSQGDILFDTFTVTTPPWLSKFQDIDGLITVNCFWYNRDSFDLKQISGRNLLSGVSGWDINTIKILSSGSQLDSGYPTVVRSGPYYFGWWYKRTGTGLGQITFFKSNNVINLLSRVSVNGGKLVSSDGLAVGDGVRVTRTGADGFFNFERLGSIVDNTDLGSFGGVGLDSSNIRRQYAGIFFTASDTDGIGEIDLRTYDYLSGSGLDSALKIINKTAYLTGYNTQGLMSIGAGGLIESGRTDVSPIFSLVEARKIDSVNNGISDSLIVSHSGGASSTNGIGSGISFKNYTGVYSSYEKIAMIAGITENDTALSGAISLSVNNASAVLTEIVRITSLGHVGIGTASPVSPLDIVTVNNEAHVLRLESNGGFGTALQFVSTSTNGRAYSMGSNFVIGLGEFSIFDDTSSSERLRITSSGSLLVPALVRSTSSSGLAAGTIWCDTSDGNRLKIV